MAKRLASSRLRVFRASIPAEAHTYSGGANRGAASVRRRWMAEVFQPLNERAADIVTKNADLLEGPSMEPLLLQLVAHVSAYRVILKRCVRPA